MSFILPFLEKNEEKKKKEKKVKKKKEKKRVEKNEEKKKDEKKKKEKEFESILKQAADCIEIFFKSNPNLCQISCQSDAFMHSNWSVLNVFSTVNKFYFGACIFA